MDRPGQIAGEVKLKVTGRGGNYADAMEKTYIAYEHGIEKFIAKSGKVRGNDITVKLDLPKERKPDSTTLTVQVTPSLAVTMLDALPYLIDYPYGCTEQTMSRFLPAVITAKTLRDLGLQPEDVMGRVFGGIETNSAAATHPKGKQDLAEAGRHDEGGPGPALRFPARRRRLGLVEARRQRSLDDGLRRVGIVAGARRRHRSEG